MDNKLTEFMLDLFMKANIRGDELEKHLILFKTYYSEIKPTLDKENMSFDARKILMAKFAQFVVEFEIICIKAYKPSADAQSTSRNIINMYLRKFEQAQIGKKG